jgi:hypothetical protein
LGTFILYTVGESILTVDREELQDLLDQFHSKEAEVNYKGATARLQDLCREVSRNAQRYLELEDRESHLGK